MSRNKIVYIAFLAIAFVAIISSCKNKRSTGLEYARNMYDPIALNPDQPTDTANHYLDSFGGHAAQVPPANTKPVGYEEYDSYPNTKDGYEAAGVSMANPLKVRIDTNVYLKEGKHLYTVFCSPCHGDKGNGKGHLVQIGKLSGIPSYYEGNSSRGGAMIDLSDGKMYHTITYGVNNMGSYSSQILPVDRWKVIMYVNKLQELKGK